MNFSPPVELPELSPAETKPKTNHSLPPVPQKIIKVNRNNYKALLKKIPVFYDPQVQAYEIEENL